jgi:putative endonuclease
VNHRRSLGDFGERVAVAHLKAKGYRIAATNYRGPEGQVDVIAQKDDVLAFVEVKTRRGGAMGSAVESISSEQAERLLAAADEFTPAGGPDLVRRIDLIAIDLDASGRVLSLEHIESAVEE